MSMRRILFFPLLAVFFLAWISCQPAEQAGPTAPPEPVIQSEWVDLFNGTDLSGWHEREPENPNRPKRPNGWKINDGVYENHPPSVDIQTDEEYYDFQLHVEFNIQEERTEGSDSGFNGNAGMYLRDKYEVQILDSHGDVRWSNGSGALYRRIAPAVNVAKPLGEWQTFEISFVGRRLTVDYNETRVLNNVDVGPQGTGGASKRDDGPGPLRIQGDHGKVFFRNVRIRPLTEEAAKAVQEKMAWEGRDN